MKRYPAEKKWHLLKNSSNCLKPSMISYSSYFKILKLEAWTESVAVHCVFLDLLSLDQSKTFYKPDWFDIVGAEVKCCKEAVCVIDMSSFTKFELTVSRDMLRWS